MSELDVLDPVPETVKLSSGTVVVLEDLRARQFFKLLRILTHGALPLVQDGSLFRLDPGLDAAEFGTRLLSIVVLAIPDAEDETIEFLGSMVRPYGLIERKGLNKQDIERNTELWNALVEEMSNPELDDLVTLVEAIVKRESADIQALGKRLGSMFNLAKKTGQIPNVESNSPIPASMTQTSSVASPAASTSSPTSTAGATTNSENSPSDASVNALPQSGNAVSTSGGSASSG